MNKKFFLVYYFSNSLILASAPSASASNPSATPTQQNQKVLSEPQKLKYTVKHTVEQNVKGVTHTTTLAIEGSKNWLKQIVTYKKEKNGTPMICNGSQLPDSQIEVEVYWGGEKNDTQILPKMMAHLIQAEKRSMAASLMSECPQTLAVLHNTTFEVTADWE